jgi:hypothetical protein
MAVRWALLAVLFHQLVDQVSVPPIAGDVGYLLLHMHYVHAHALRRAAGEPCMVSSDTR